MKLPGLFRIAALPVVYTTQVHIFHSGQDPFGQLVARQTFFYSGYFDGIRV